MTNNYLELTGGICATWCLVSMAFMFAMMEKKQKEISILEDIRANLAKRPLDS